MTAFRIAAALIFALMVNAGVVQAADNINPAYHAWSHFGVGSSETLTGTVDRGNGMTITTTTVTTLLEKAADHVVVQSASTIIIDGESHVAPPRKLSIPSATDPTKEMTEIGTEDIQAAGKTISCKIYTLAHPDPQSKGKVTIWSNTDIPGGTVKLQIESPTTKLVQTLKSYDTK